MSRRLYRSTEHKIIGGVCGGLGEHFDVDPTWMRIGFVVLVALTKGVGLLLYVIGWVIIPKQKPEDLVEVSTDTGAESSTKSGKSEFNTSYLPGSSSSAWALCSSCMSRFGGLISTWSGRRF